MENDKKLKNFIKTTIREFLNEQKLNEISEMNIETTNFENFTADEYRDNLLRLGAVSHSSLVGLQVFYSNKIYGLHRIEKWDADKAEFLLNSDGHRFWSNPFRIFI